MISVVLTGYKRRKYLKEQYDALQKQTMKPTEIMLWQNAGQKFWKKTAGKTTWASCNKNLGVWARFAYALNARSEYVCVFDDDTIPGTKWLQNCYDTIQAQEGLLGTIGVIFESVTGYHPMRRVGWDAPNEVTTRVDIVGHCWFFKREWLSAFWRELPEPTHPLVVGEDIHFSAMIQKYLGLASYVPPHPTNDLEKWGSKPKSAWLIGRDEVAVSMNPKNIDLMSDLLRRYISRGFKTIMQE